MSDSRFEHLHNLPCGSTVLYTMTLLVLGVGYLFAMAQVFEVHAGRDGKPGLSTTDLVIAYGGSHADTRMEAALKGPMMGMIPAEEREIIFSWIHTKGGGEEEYNKAVKPIIEKRCLACHDGNNPHVPDLSSFAGVSRVMEKDTGMDIFSLIRISHIHLFGLTFIFFITSMIFVHTHVHPVWLKCTIIATPFIAILLDIGSWYLTKIHPGFAWAVMIGGALMGLTFAIQWFVSMYQMWFYKGPPELRETAKEQEHKLTEETGETTRTSIATETPAKKTKNKNVRILAVLALLGLGTIVLVLLSRGGEEHLTQPLPENGKNIALTKLGPISGKISTLTDSGDGVIGKDKAVRCITCHGADGNSLNPEWPILAGQNAEYIVSQLLNYRSGKRSSSIMEPMVGYLSDKDIADLAVFFEDQQRKPGDPVDAKMAAAGEKLYREETPERSQAVVCAACHGSTGQGEPGYGVPALNGQHSAYLFEQLKKIGESVRQHPHGKSILEGLTMADLKALSVYLQGLTESGAINIAATPSSR